jgi:hypothetical protein
MIGQLHAPAATFGIDPGTHWVASWRENSVGSGLLEGRKSPMPYRDSNPEPSNP